MRFLIRARNRTVAVENGRIAPAEGAFAHVLDLPDADLRPGLINAHDHLHRNHYGPLGRPPYANAGEWARDIQARSPEVIAAGRRLPRREALLEGAWKNLFAGVTSVVHHDPWERDFDDDFPIRVLPVATADSLTMTPDAAVALRGERVALHVAEGIDAAAAREVATLAAAGLLGASLIAVHCVGVSAADAARLRRAGAAFVWCPTSNLFLLGRTAPREMFVGLDVMLGSDSLLTGAGDLLDELRTARELGRLDDARLEAAVSGVAARRLNAPEPSLEVGAPADLAAFAAPPLEAHARDVRLVVVDGVPRVAAIELASALDRLSPGGVAMRRGDVRRWTAALPFPSDPRRRRMPMTTASLRALLLGGALTLAAPALAQAPVEAAPAPADAAPTPDAAPEPPAKETDILSADTLTVLLDGRLVLADGQESWVSGGFGKTRFDGNRQGDFEPKAIPAEADLIWAPRFTRALSGNVSAAWQRDQENPVDILEGFVTYLPERGTIGMSAKAGLYWPEISLEHATGGAWSTVNTITPSAINAWVGEEVKVIGAEASIYATLGQHDFNATAGVFGFNDTSGTLLSFRGWALHDFKATAFGHFDLPPLNPFITLLQQDKTRSTIELDNRPGFYGRVEWRPPWPFSINVFYYDNRGNPEAFEATGQWGWRTRFVNVGLSAELGAGTRLLAQGMVGTTQMGFKENGRTWVDTYYRSAFVLVTHDFGAFALTGRVEAFGTHERGSEMSPANGEDGAAFTLAGRKAVTDRLTAFVEALHVRSNRGTRVDIGLPAFETQTVLQAALRFRW